MSSLLIKNATVVTPTEILRSGSIFIHRGKIRHVERGVLRPGEAPQETIDASGKIVVPGYIDLQVNGGVGEEFSQSPSDKYEKIIRFFVSHGTTTMLAAVMTDAPERMLEAIRRVAEFQRSTSEYAAAVAGTHVEGPFLNPLRRGAHPKNFLREPDTREVRRWIAVAPEEIRMVTLAPELKGAQKVIKLLRGEGAVVAASHSCADYTCMGQSVKNGLSFVTHIGNTNDWPYRKQRKEGWLGVEPGVVGSFLCMEELRGSVIMDGFHFHPALLKPLLLCKGETELALVTDAAFVAGLPPGIYRKGRERVTVTEAGYTAGRRKGWLAGSVLTMDRAVRNAVKLAGASLTEAVTMASLTPAIVLGMEKRKGRIARGRDADILILDSELSVQTVVLGGKVLGHAGSA